MPSPHYTTAKKQGPDPKTWPFSVTPIPFTPAEGGQAAGGGMTLPLTARGAMGLILAWLCL